MCSNPFRCCPHDRLCQVALLPVPSAAACSDERKREERDVSTRDVADAAGGGGCSQKLEHVPRELPPAAPADVGDERNRIPVRTIQRECLSAATEVARSGPAKRVPGRN